MEKYLLRVVNAARQETIHISPGELLSSIRCDLDVTDPVLQHTASWSAFVHRNSAALYILCKHVRRVLKDMWLGIHELEFCSKPKKKKSPKEISVKRLRIFRFHFDFAIEQCGKRFHAVWKNRIHDVFDASMADGPKFK
ncbi:hypothetical protein CEXT_259191 [Caerostris extrusa]|uniref:Uncharacterized protein n=1 Tax=Caerostris extrusa TaxID=172846 RepID=A0AAV4PEA0_CAEEX|nr:hypothetical protein CEXT_259191 [Caerostris extrusa]